MQKKLTTRSEYKAALKFVDALIAKQEKQLTIKEQRKLKELAEVIEAFEDEHYPLPAPKTLVGMIQLKMFQQKLKQKELANILEIPESRVSELMKGKRKITLPIAKKLYEKLEIPADFILQNA